MSLNNLNKFLTLSVLLLCQTAFATQADRNLPIEIEADTATANFKDEQSKTIFSGNVIVTQGTLLVTASNVELFKNNNKQQQINATGNPVHFQQDLDNKRNDGSNQQIKGKAQKITYDSESGNVVLTGQAKVERDGDTVTGDMITYNTHTEVFSGKAIKKGNRVSVVIQPSSVQKKNNNE